MEWRLVKRLHRGFFWAGRRFESARSMRAVDAVASRSAFDSYRFRLLDIDCGDFDERPRLNFLLRADLLRYPRRL